MPRFFRRKDIILFLLLAALIHILLTFLVSHRVGKITGHKTSATLSGTVPDNKLTARQLRDIPDPIADAPKGYRTIVFFLSLPFGPLLQPIHQRWALRPVLEGEVRLDEYAFRASLIGTVTRLLNALAFSLLAYAFLFLVVRQMNRRTDKHR